MTPEFFAAHTITSLLNWSDYQLEGEGRLTDPVAYDRATDTMRKTGKAGAWVSSLTLLRLRID